MGFCARLAHFMECNSLSNEFPSAVAAFLRLYLIFLVTFHIPCKHKIFKELTGIST